MLAGAASNGGSIESADWVASELWRRGFKSMIDVDPGREGAVAAAARKVGLKYIAARLDATGVDAALKAMSDSANQPIYLNSPNGRSTATIWMIKRVLADGWTIEQAGAEATSIGLVNDDASVPALWKFAQDYIGAHRK